MPDVKCSQTLVRKMGGMQAYLYGILDVAAKVGFGAFILANDEKLQTSYGK